MTNRWISIPFTHLSSDIPSGIVVFLVALPLCLGIALASGAPLFAGIIAGVVGGVILAMFSGSELSVSGPAAGLASIVAAAIISLGSFQTFLVAVVLAGIFQIIIGLLRAGSLGNYIPHGVIKGMLAAIGITIIFKQLPHAFGYDPNFVDEETAFGGMQWLNIFTDPIEAVRQFHPGAVIITAISLAILIAWDRPFIKRQKWSRVVPGALIVVILGIVINELFASADESFYLSTTNNHLVQLPVATSVSGFMGLFSRPDFSQLFRVDVLLTALTIAAIASIESILSVEATDKMDPQRRISDTNKELVAQGIGNMISGLLGGLPVTSVIARSSANVYAGARTRMSAMFHGTLLFLTIALIPTLLNKIPYACLAAVLFVIGYKLSSIQIIRNVWKEGMAQFIPFIITVVMIVATDLLLGVGVGILVSIFWVMRSNHHAAMSLTKNDGIWLLKFKKDVTFINKAELKDVLRRVPENAQLTIDGSRALYVDHDIYETLHDFETTATYRNTTVTYKNVHGKDTVGKVQHGRIQEAFAE